MRGDRCLEVTNNNPAQALEKSVRTEKESQVSKVLLHRVQVVQGLLVKPRDLDFIPEMVGGKEKQPAGAHIHDRARTGTIVGKAIPLVDANAKVTGQAWYGDDVRLPNEIIGTNRSLSTSLC